jgi:Ser/Thr protein kinase RdoA (MazF antagonist)
MGVITYLFHRSEGITPQRFHMFFLDVGENIHFHYRDLRIELSTGEFEELAAGFMKYAPSVLDMIRNEGYRDGVLPNTNAHDTIKTFWDKGKLVHPVKYNQQRLSIEENVDGFHIHFRNYKLLLDRTSFTEFARAMSLAMLQLDNRPPVDPVRILEINDLAPSVLSRVWREGREDIVVVVDPAYREKAEQALTGIGFAHKGTKRDGTLVKGDQQVTLTAGRTGPAEVGDQETVPAPGMVSLATFIDRHAGKLTAEELNLFKLRLLYLFKRAETGHIPAFRIGDVYVNVESNTPSVDLFRVSNALDPVAEYGRLSQLLTQKKLFFVKPGKQFYSQEQRSALNEKFEKHIRENIGSNPCVNRVYVLGSSTKDRSGVYNVPFVHFDWAKLASDFDLLIELEPDYENDIPPTWEKKFDWPRSGSVYAHLGDLGKGMESDYAKTYPGIRFFEQMLETYLFYPSKGNRAAKDEFVNHPHTRVIFERPGIIDWFEQHYPFRIKHIKRVKVASFNKVYDISTDSRRFALKVYPDRNHQGETHQPLAYELALTEQLVVLALDIPSPIRNTQDDYVSEHPEGKAVLFQYIEGKYLHEPSDKDAFAAGQLLARMHLYSDQIEIPSTITPPRIVDTLLHWLKAYRGLANKGLLPDVPDLDDHIAHVQQVTAPMVHCHGDVSPRNFIYRDGNCWLIDFQLAGLGPAIVDLSDGMIEFAARGKHFNQGAMDAFLSGYQSILKLKADEMDALSRLLPAQVLAKQARTARAHDYGFEWNADLIGSLQRALEVFGHATSTSPNQDESAQQ